MAPRSSMRRRTARIIAGPIFPTCLGPIHGKTSRSSLRMIRTVRLGPVGRKLHEPRARDRFEAVRIALLAKYLFLGLALQGRIDVAFQQSARLVASCSRFLQAYLRIHTQGQALLFAFEEILEPPPLSSAGRGRGCQIAGSSCRQFSLRGSPGRAGAVRLRLGATLAVVATSL